MKVLVVYSHPNTESFNGAILNRVTKRLEEKQAEYKVRNLYAPLFNPVTTLTDLAARSNADKLPDDVKKEQDLIAWADTIVFIYPIWWGAAPAVLKGWWDRVLTPGFAYKYTASGVAKLLTDKKAIIFNTMGTPESVYKANGMLAAITNTSDKSVLGFCGIETIAHKFFGAIMTIEDFTRNNMLDEVETTIEMFV